MMKENKLMPKAIQIQQQLPFLVYLSKFLSFFFPHENTNPWADFLWNILFIIMLNILLGFE